MSTALVSRQALQAAGITLGAQSKNEAVSLKYLSSRKNSLITDYDLRLQVICDPTTTDHCEPCFTRKTATKAM